MKLVDPTVTSSQVNNRRAPALTTLQGKTIGLLSNRKLNADLLLQETAACLIRRHGGRALSMAHKANPSAPAPADKLTDLSPECDYLLTATGD
ncbi:MAG: hypothetical protein ABGY96_15875 [bacterium]|nr:hypothetical protein [Gammaproteobacteria bacterium]